MFRKEKMTASVFALHSLDLKFMSASVLICAVLFLFAATVHAQIKPGQGGGCAQLLKSLSIAVQPENLETEKISFSLSKTGFYTEEEMILWAEKAGAVLSDSACKFTLITFSAAGKEDTQWEGNLQLTDYQLYKLQKISRAEFVRRLDLKSEVTLASLKIRLKAARIKKDGDASLVAIEQWLKLEENAVAPKIIKANILIEQGEYFAAQNLLDEVLLNHPANTHALFNKAFTQKKLGRFAEAVLIYRKLLASQPEPAISNKDLAFSRDDVLMQLADAYLNNKQLSEASEVLAQVQDQNSPSRRIMQASLLRLKGQYSDARKLLETLVREGKASDVVYYNLVLVSLDQKDADSARKNLTLLQNLNESWAKDLEFLEPLKRDSTATGTSTATATVKKKGGK